MMKKLFLRYAVLFWALLIMALGIALCIRANLGITPISCPPYVLSLGLPLTVGQFTIIMHILLIIGQIILLRHEFRPIQLLQIVPAMGFGLFIDFWMHLTEWITPHDYAISIITLLSGNLLLALGVHFEMKAHVVMLPTDGFVQAVSTRTGKPFAGMKTAFDLSLLLISIACSLLLFGRIEGVREGTFISAFLVGILVGLLRKIDMSANGRKSHCRHAE